MESIDVPAGAERPIDGISLESLAGWPAQTLDEAELRGLVERGEIESVIVATPDIQGKLFGKSMPAPLFLGDVEMEVSSGPLTYDNDWNILEGRFPDVGEANGWADLRLQPDFRSLRRLANIDRTAIVVAEGIWADGRPVEQSPRRVLARQLERCLERDLAIVCGIECEFYVFAEDYASARRKHYQDLDLVADGAADYSILHLSLLDPLISDIRRQCMASGIPIETIKHEWGRVQLELTLTYADAMEAADRITLFKLITKEVALRHGVVATFMARYSHHDAGSSGHVHLSVWDRSNGEPLLVDSIDTGALGELGRNWLGGQMALAGELMPLFCPNVNSYKRLDLASFGPATNAWSIDSRSVPFRLVGSGPSLRVENRIPGADANFYLAVAGMIAAGLHGIEHGLQPLGEPVTRAEAPGEKLPRSLRESVELLHRSEAVRSALGDGVVNHLIATAEHELEVFDMEVTDVERRRSFECS